jgi:hypothetical protein
MPGKGGKVHLPLRSTWNGRLVGQPHAGVDMVFNFPQLIAHLCKTRNARAGSIVGSGTVSNKDASRGYSCIAEQRCLETIEFGQPVTQFMRFGDTIRIEMLDEKGKSIFGAIEQKVVRWNANVIPAAGTVIPAKAGIHACSVWIPAFAKTPHPTASPRKSTSTGRATLRTASAIRSVPSGSCTRYHRKATPDSRSFCPVNSESFTIVIPSSRKSKSSTSMPSVRAA